MHKKYLVTLTAEERAQLLDLTKKGSATARKLTRAHLLLQADDGATDQAIATALHIHRTTVERTRQRFVEGNLDGALAERPRPGAKRLLDAKQEAWLIATACSAAPKAKRAGRCNCSPMNWWPWRWWRPSPTKPSVAR